MFHLERRSLLSPYFFFPSFFFFFGYIILIQFIARPFLQAPWSSLTEAKRLSGSDFVSCGLVCVFVPGLKPVDSLGVERVGSGCDTIEQKHSYSLENYGRMFYDIGYKFYILPHFLAI